LKKYGSQTMTDSPKVPY